MPDASTGARLVKCEDTVSAAYASKLLVDLGAEVIKIESPRGGDEAHRPGYERDSD